MEDANEITLPQVGGISEAVSDGVDEIEDQTGQAFNLYNGIIERAQKGVPEDLEWSFDTGQTSLSEIGVEDTSVDLSTDVEQELHDVDSPETVSFEADTVSEYTDEITSRIDEVQTNRRELESRIESAENLSQQALSEYLESTQVLDTYDDPEAASEGIYGEKGEQLEEMRTNEKNARRAIENLTTTLRSEETALQKELVNVVNNYVSEAYDHAVDISEELGGTARPYEGEIELLTKIADSRAQILENRGDPEDYEFVPPELAAQTALTDVSKEAMEQQAALVAQLASQMGMAADESQDLVDDTEPYIEDENDIRPAYDALDAMNEGFGEMADVVEEESYDNFAEAMRMVMQRGMAEEEEFDDEYSFEMDDISYIGSSEHAGGRL